jgi:predicted transcriptional regulator of viral defense system
MNKSLVPFQRRKDMTQLSEALMHRLNKSGYSLISNYNFFHLLLEFYQAGNVKYLRSNWPSKASFNRVRAILQSEGVIRKDQDYAGCWRILAVPEASADEIVCFIDPYCYISHYSAMQRYGLTNRRPETLTVTVPATKMVRQSLKEKMRLDYGDALEISNLYKEPAQIVRHPSVVRGRKVAPFATVTYGDWRKIKGTPSRIGTIGQTFLDMLDQPDRCGGTHHILSVWEGHAKTYLDEIIDSVTGAPKSIHKVRAGYILEERLGVSDSRVAAWQKFAQRGGSRVLDPSRAYVDRYSARWMISINVD